MSGAKTEQPTPRRLREARRRGEVGVSRELSAAAALAGGLAGLSIAGAASAGELASLLRGTLAGVALPADPAAVVQRAAWTVLRLSLAPCAGALAAAVLVAALQAGPGGSLEAVRPRLDRLDPLRGLRRLFSFSQLGAAALGALKGAVLLWLAWSWLRDAAAGLAGLPRLDAAALLRAVPSLGSLAARLAAAFAVLGLLDLALARRRHLRSLRMTRDEVRREHKQDEGDPAHQAERRRRHRALLEAGPVARATVVVVNPTHVAVALRHDRAGDGAPRVLAKGTGPAAARIRSAARRAGVPIVRDLMLARSLHRLAEVGEEIPEELYEAAAAVLAHLYRDEVRP